MNELAERADLVVRDGLWIEVFEFTGRDLALGDERIDLTLFQPDNPAESVRRQLPLVDQSVQGARGQSKRRCGFFRREPIAVCRSHGLHLITLPSHTLSAPLSIFRNQSGDRS